MKRVLPRFRLPTHIRPMILSSLGRSFYFSPPVQPPPFHCNPILSAFSPSFLVILPFTSVLVFAFSHFSISAIRVTSYSFCMIHSVTTGFFVRSPLSVTYQSFCSFPTPFLKRPLSSRCPSLPRGPKVLRGFPLYLFSPWSPAPSSPKPFLLLPSYTTIPRDDMNRAVLVIPFPSF